MSEMTLERLSAFGAAWRGHDVDAAMSFMTDDCEFRASVGTEPGTTFVGREEVRRGFKLMLAYDGDAEAQAGRAFVAGDVGMSQWSFVHRNGDGSQVEVRGCDVYEFVGDRIRVKDAYRKVAGRIGGATG